MSSSNSLLVPLRQQYPFDIPNLRYKSRSEVFRLQRQWDTFERIENYDDIIFQRISVGMRDKTFYQFKDDSEYKDYRAGHNLHVLRYPDLPPSLFEPIRHRPVPNVEAITELPYYSQVPRGLPDKKPLNSLDYSQIQSDNTIYTYVSSYNAAHVYKYNFTSDEEKMAYERAERRILGLF
jgi:hypothetical protein